MLFSKDPLKEKNKIFAEGLNLYKLVWIFFIGSILGVLVEILWCLLTLHRIESRSGLLYGPFNLVYGFGSMAITLSLYWLRKKDSIYVFIGGFLVGGTFEYICSWIQQVIFGTVSWEYSGMILNIQGRTNFFYCIFWGILSVLWIKVVYPGMSTIIERIPYKKGIAITWVIIVFMIFNSGISAMAVFRGTERHSGVPASNSIERFLDKHYPDNKLKKVYPNMIYVENKAKQSVKK